MPVWKPQRVGTVRREWYLQGNVSVVAGGNAERLLSQWIQMSCKDHRAREHYHQRQCYSGLSICSHNKLMAFEYANKLIPAKASVICFGLCRTPDPKATAQVSYIHFVLFYIFCFTCCLICTRDTLWYALCWHVCLCSLSFLGLALTSGTTHIRATLTRMWWKTILRCSIVSGLELGLSCSKVVASACGCYCSVELELSISHCVWGLGCFVQAIGNRERPLGVQTKLSVNVHVL